MIVWLVTVGEPLPLEGEKGRPLRTGLLARYLCSAGHDVIWWTSAFDHVRKIHRSERDTNVRVDSRLRVVLLKAPGYPHNVSLSRLLDHAILGGKFRKLAKREVPPDIVVVSMPTLELADAACDYAQRRAIPAVVDIRDLWPDVFIDAFPGPLKRGAHLLLSPYRRMARRSCSRATAVIGPTLNYVDWGLAHAGRAATEADRDFPFAYPSARPEPAKIADAVSFWATHGVSESDGRSNVCFFGTLGRQFDLNTLLVAARYLQESAPALRFVLCGTGDKEAALREAARSCSNVLFPGWVDPAQMWTLMRMSCIGLAPYLPTGNFIDHIPNKPVEYLSAGLPVLTTLPGTLGQLLLRKNCGVVYRTGDAAELAGHLKHLHEDPAKLRTLSRNAAALYRESFCAETVYSDLVRHLEHIAGTSAAKTKIKAHTLNSLPNSDRKRLL